jgi:hypothetical protein
VVFAPTEVVQLRHEVEVAINAPIPWRYPEVDPEDRERNVLAPLDDVTRSGRWMAMRLCM